MPTVRSVRSVRRRPSPVTRHSSPSRQCVYCGCTDSSACPGGCCWILEFPKTNTGICSQCDTRALAALVKAINEADSPVVITKLGRKYLNNQGLSTNPAMP